MTEEKKLNKYGYAMNPFYDAVREGKIKKGKPPPTNEEIDKHIWYSEIAPKTTKPIVQMQDANGRKYWLFKTTL